MSTLSSPIKIEKKLNEQMEKFLLRQNTSQRQLLSKISSKVVNNELVFIQKFKTPKKLVIGKYKTPIIINSPELQSKSALLQESSPLKFNRKLTVKVTNSYTTEPMSAILSPVSRTNLNSPEYSPRSIIDKFNVLIDTISLTPPQRILKFRRNQKKVQRICRSIKSIAREKKKILVKDKKYAFEYEKKYLKEVIKDMRERKEAEMLQECKDKKIPTLQDGIQKDKDTKKSYFKKPKTAFK